MDKIDKSIVIQAPIEKVFEFVTKPENFAKAQPPEAGTKIITSPKGPPKVGNVWKMGMKAGGQAYEWENEVTEVIDNKKVSRRQKGGPFKKLEWTQSFEASEGGTRFSMKSEYEMPYSILGKIIDKLKIEKEMDKNFDHFMKKMKELIEKS